MTSGFRIQLISIAIVFLLGIAYRGGFWSVLISSFLGMVGLSLLAFINLIMPLPPNIQRTLTFLPGTWEQRYRDDATGSTDWRIVMWKEALLSDKWIANKWIGDGLGFTKKELDTMQNSSGNQHQLAISGLTNAQESFMISGGYHSGPVVTVRTIGYVGLFILMFGFVRMMVHAHHQIIRSRDTEWYTPVMFICIPIIAGPLCWTFLYGSFEGGAGILVMGCAMVRLLERNLPLPARASSARQPPLFVNTRHHLAS